MKPDFKGSQEIAPALVCRQHKYRFYCNFETAIENVSPSLIKFKGKKNLVNRLKEYLNQLGNELK